MIGRSDWEDTLYRCNDNNWCCSGGGNTTSCCQDTRDGSNLLKLPEGTLGQIENGTNFVPGYTIAAISALQTSSAKPSRATTGNGGPSQAVSTSGTKTTQSLLAATSTGIVPTTPAVAANNADGGHKVAAVGAGVGVGVGVPLLAALGAVLFLYFREKRLTKDLKGQLASGIDRQYRSEPKAPFPPVEGFQELQTARWYQQLPADRQDVNVELESSGLGNKK